MTERPAPMLLPGGDLVVPAEDLAELLAVLRSHVDLCRGVARPSAAPRPVLTPAVRAIAGEVERGAVAHQRARHRASADGRTAAGVPHAEAAGWSWSGMREGWSVARAAGFLGVSERHVRRLLEQGQVQGRKAERDTWLIDEVSIRTYEQTRQVPQ